LLKLARDKEIHETKTIYKYIALVPLPTKKTKNPEYTVEKQKTKETKNGRSTVFAIQPIHLQIELES